MENRDFVKKTTYVITIIILLVIFLISTICIVFYYENRNIKVNIPTVVETNSDDNLSGISIDTK